MSHLLHNCQELNRLLEAVKNPFISDTDDACKFVGNAFHLIFKCRQYCMAHELYASTVRFYKNKVLCAGTADDILKEAVAFRLAFPDLSFTIRDLWGRKISEDYYKVYRLTSYCGTNLGYSKYGLPTGRNLGKSFICASKTYIRRIDGSWQITFEQNDDLDDCLREARAGHILAI